MGRGPGGAVPKLNVIFEDKDILVVDKPAGLLSANMPGETRESLFDQVKAYVRGERRKPVRVWIIHRLDKEASGLLVFAKTEKAFQWLKEDFRSKRVHRLYVAVVEGEIKDERGTVDAGADDATARVMKKVRQLPGGTIQSFMRDDESGKVRSVGVGEIAREGARGRGAAMMGPQRRTPRPGPAGGLGGGLGGGPGGRPGPGPDDEAPRLAVTHWRVLATGEGRSLLQLRLETGRKNQIRVHMQEFKHPIIGDARYGATIDPIGRMALHATELGFTHPATGQTARYYSPAPPSFYRAVGVEPPPMPAREKPAEPALEIPDGIAGADQPAGPEARKASPPNPPTPAALPPKAAAETSWDHVAEWYDELIEEERSDHFRHVIVPGTLRLLRPPTPGGSLRVLDIACGQGALARKMGELGLEVVGVDASPRLIEAARRRAEAALGPAAPVRFETADARALESLPADILDLPFDAATCVMALMNIDPLEPVLRGAAAAIREGGAFVAVILHPAFRAPGQTSWQWETRGPGGEKSRTPVRQFRRVDGYLSPGQMPITMNPGRAAHGQEAVVTLTFHRPIQTYVKAFAEAGFAVDALEEWPSMRRSQPGPRAAEENRARREIPMFLGIRAVKTSRPG